MSYEIVSKYTCNNLNKTIQSKPSDTHTYQLVETVKGQLQNINFNIITRKYFL